MRRLVLFSILLCLPFTQQAADYYWVGGTGNWSDISHWAAASGGSVTYSQAPSADDNVIFDGNSFSGPNQVVTINTDIIFFRNMRWIGVTNNPTFTGPLSATMNAFGALALSPNMNFDFIGETRFLGDAMNLGINYAGHDAGLNIVFEGSGGWTFNGPVVIDSSLSIRRGNLNTNSQNVNCRFFNIEGNEVKTLTLANSTITLTGGFRQDDDIYAIDYNYEVERKSLYVNLENLSLDAGTSRIVLSAKDPGIWIIGDGSIAFHDVIFSATTGIARLSRWYYNNQIDFNEVSIFSSAKVLTKIDAQTLNLTGGNVYEFLAGETFDFGTINANGNCANGVVVTSTENSSIATFNISSGNVDIAFLTLRDIYGAGGASFTASSGVDLGNNNGWNFTNNASEDFYWIGGTGNWSDAAHWSYTSGGIPSGCVPSGKDNVFFDANSFSSGNQVVTVDKENIYMHDMTWNGVSNLPELAGDFDFQIRITGSLEFDSSIDHSFEGSYFFESSEENLTIRTNGIVFNQDINFSGASGEWSFLDNLEVTKDLIFRSGNLNTNGFDVTIYRLQSEFEAPRNLNISDSYILLRQSPDDGYYYPWWNVNVNQYSVNSENSTLEFTGGTSDGFYHHGNLVSQDKPTYNNVVFSNYFGQLNSRIYDLPDGDPQVLIDTLIFRNRGELYGSSGINYMQLAGGYDYSFDSDSYRDDVQTIGELSTSGSCEAGMTKLFASTTDGSAKIDLGQNFTSERLDIRGIIAQGSGTFTANSSIDAGGNMNIDFTDFTSRTLYWVDNGGLWHDTNHWSLSSGGAGGECIPTAIDDVIFDANSFDLDFQYVNSDGNRFRNCHDITWTNTTNNPSFQDGFIIVNGSLEYDDSFNNDVWQTRLTSGEQEIIDPNGQFFGYFHFRGEGEFNFVSNFESYEMAHNSGTINFDNIEVTSEYFTFDSQSPKLLNLAGSTVTLIGNSYTYASNVPFRDWSAASLTVDPGNSNLILTGESTGIYSEGNISFNNIHFNNVSGTGTIASQYYSLDEITTNTIYADKVLFNGDGEIFGIVEADTIIGSAGKTYIFDSDQTSQVNSYLQMIGNNCTPIELRSSQSGNKATINMPASGTVVADFVQMQDMRGTGGADFNAGSRSTDIANSNIGWTFEDAPDFVESGFLGVDRALCTGQDLVLDAYSFSPNEIYTWNDGSMDSILSVNMPGEYFVEVQFETSCILRDTIEIFTAQDIMAMLPPTGMTCEGTAFILDATVPIATASYLWTDGSTNPVFDVITSGDYSVQIDVDGCISSATSTVTVVDNPGLDLGGDRSICDGELFTLETDVVATSYEWQDGSMSQSNIGILEGLYWLEIEFDNCSFRDSALITYTPRPDAEIGNDTVKCSNEELSLTVNNVMGHDVLWQDGSMNNSLEVMGEGSFVVIVDDNGCISKDSIFVSVVQAPVVDLGQDIMECEGNMVSIMVPNPSLDFEWEDGSNEADRQIEDSGDFILTVQENGCSERDSINVAFQALPRIELGQDTTVCDDVPFILMPQSQTLGNITWEDGSTNSSFLVESPGLINVTLTEGLCIGRDSIQVNFKECINFEAFIPNAFSPNEDGVNDRLEIFFADGLIIESFAITIFDRWGNRVFTSKSTEETWDGKFNTQDLDTGVYGYFINVSYIDDFGPDETILTGDITILN